MSVEVIWEDPPPRQGRYARPPCEPEVLAELQRHPKRWARIATFTTRSSASSRATAINQGKRAKSMPPGKWEAAGRTLGPNTSALYLRYMGK